MIKFSKLSVQLISFTDILLCTYMHSSTEEHGRLIIRVFLCITLTSWEENQTLKIYTFKLQSSV